MSEGRVADAILVFFAAGLAPVLLPSASSATRGRRERGAVGCVRRERVVLLFLRASEETADVRRRAGGFRVGSSWSSIGSDCREFRATDREGGSVRSGCFGVRGTAAGVRDWRRGVGILEAGESVGREARR